MVLHVSPSLFCIAARHRDDTADHCGKAQARKELIEAGGIPYTVLRATVLWVISGQFVISVRRPLYP
jgi:hypothetical protein